MVSRDRERDVKHGELARWSQSSEGERSRCWIVAFFGPTLKPAHSRFGKPPISGILHASPRLT